MSSTAYAERGPVSRSRMLLNFAAFQAGWFACALTAGAGWPMAGPAIVGGIVVMHLYFCEERVSEGRLLAVVTLLGGAIDTAQWVLGFSIGPIEGLPGVLAVVWFAAMYANFATTLRYSLRWLGGRPWLAVALGATGGPSTYWAGAGFGAIEIVEPGWRSLLVLAVVWGALTPGLFALEGWLRRRENEGRARQ